MTNIKLRAAAVTLGVIATAVATPFAIYLLTKYVPLEILGISCAFGMLVFAVGMMYEIVLARLQADEIRKTLGKK